MRDAGLGGSMRSLSGGGGGVGAAAKFSYINWNSPPYTPEVGNHDTTLSVEKLGKMSRLSTLHI
jgi:hypothetical protein